MFPVFQHWDIHQQLFPARVGRMNRTVHRSSVNRPANHPVVRFQTNQRRHLRKNVEVFIEQYYNRARLHSTLGYRPAEGLERRVAPGTLAGAATLQFFQPAERAESEGAKSVKQNIQPTEVC